MSKMYLEEEKKVRRNNEEIHRWRNNEIVVEVQSQ